MLFSEIYKKGYGAPSPSDLIEGGIGIDVTGKKAYSKATDSTIFQIGPTDEEMAAKVDVVTGKGLSANDFTDTYKDKLGIALTIPDPVPTEDNIVTFDATGEVQDSEVPIGEIALKQTILAAEYTQLDSASPLANTTHTFDYALGDMQHIVAPGSGTDSLTLAFTGFPLEKVAGFIIDIVNGGNCTIIHPSTMLFDRGVSPTYTVAGTDRVLILKDKFGVYTLSVVAYDLQVL